MIYSSLNIMKKIFILFAAVMLLAACSKEKTFTIEGSFNIPESYELADTVLTRGPITGYVYMLDLDGEPLDSARIIEEKFSFSGVVNSDQPYFAYLVSEYAAGMFVIEPGDMKAVIGEPVAVTGTSTNDAITNLMARVDTIGYMLYDEMSALQEQNPDSTLDQNAIMEIYGKYSSQVDHMVDSIYQKNTENLLGVYCANVMTAQVQSAAELEAALATFSDFVKNSELIQQHYKYLQGSEAQYSGGEDNLGN